MAFGAKGVKIGSSSKLNRRELAELKRRKQQEDVALQSVCDAKKLLEKVDFAETYDTPGAEIEAAEKNIDFCDDAIDLLIKAVRYDEDLNAAFFWRAEAYRIRAVSLRQGMTLRRDGRVNRLDNPRKFEEEKKKDLRCALGDVDHTLRFYDPKEFDSASQSWISWQLRGRIRAQLGDPNYSHDFATAQYLEPETPMTYLLWARCLWRDKQLAQAKLKLEEGLGKCHNSQVKDHMEAELAELVKQTGEWEQWEAEEADRIKCAIM